MAIRCVRASKQKRPSRDHLRGDGSEHDRQVGYAADACRAGVHVRSESSTGQRCVAAIAPADDANAFWIDDALRDQRLHSVGDIVLHAQAPLLPAGIGVGTPTSGRAAELRLQHGVAARCEELRQPVEAGLVAGFGTAVRHHHQRQIFFHGIGGQSQVAGQRVLVARLVVEVAHGAEFHAAEQWIGLIEDVGLLRGVVDQVVDRGMGFVFDEHHDLLVVRRAAHQT